jgi:hypothetical protein
MPPVPRKTTAPGTVTEGLRQMEQFFRGKDQVHKTLRRLVKKLEKAGIVYAVLGGMALNAHRYRRVTTDVDVLLTGEGFGEFKRRFVGKDYEQVEGRPRRFTDRKNGVRLDVLVTGLYPGSGRPGPVAFPDPGQASERIEDVAYVDLVTLVQLKLAARRWRDFADVVELIRHNELDESFQEKLHPSVRSDYVECLGEKRREDEYEARE